MDVMHITSGEQKIAPIYVLCDGEIVLNGRIEAAWRHMLNYPAWQNYTIVEHISGEIGQEGEVVFLKKEEEGITSPPYYARTIKLNPPHRVIWKTFPYDSSSANDFVGIVDFRLEEFPGDRARFKYQLLQEFVVPYQSEQELDEFKRNQQENMTKLLSAILPKLQRLVEKDRT